MPSLIHPTAIIGDNVIIEDDVYIGPYCIIGMPPEWKGKEQYNKGVIIKKGTKITGLVTIDGGAERVTEIGTNCYIMKHAYIAHDCILGSDVTMSAGSKLAGFCTVGNKVNLGMGVAVHQKSTLPEGIMIGMNGVVTKKSKLEPYQKYVGMPIKNIGVNKREPRITISIACYKRPERTKRSIQCILDQDIIGWEAFIMGDACPDFQKLIDSGYLQSIKEEQEKKGNIIHYFNADVNGGGCGYKLINYAVQNATGKYLIFYANDDIILPNHFSHYLSEIENTEYNLVYYNSNLAPFNNDRETLMQISSIGHCDIIIKTELAKKLNLHTEKYTHDWDFINEAAQLGNYKKANSKLATYKVMRLGSQPEIENIN